MAYIKNLLFSCMIASALTAIAMQPKAQDVLIDLIQKIGA